MQSKITDRPCNKNIDVKLLLYVNIFLQLQIFIDIILWTLLNLRQFCRQYRLARSQGIFSLSGTHKSCFQKTSSSRIGINFLTTHTLLWWLKIQNHCLLKLWMPFISMEVIIIHVYVIILSLNPHQHIIVHCWTYYGPCPIHSTDCAMNGEFLASSYHTGQRGLVLGLITSL